MKRNQAKKTSRRSRRKRNKGLLTASIVLEIAIVLLLLVVIFWNRGLGEWVSSFSEPVVKELDLSGLNSPHAVLMRSNGKILGEIEKDEQIYPASMTKMMTAVVALEALDDLDTSITVTAEMAAGLAEQDASQAGFQIGESVRAEDLIYGALLPSGAECCRALAYQIAGSETAFVERMNQKAAKIGMKNTHFCDSIGLHNPEQYSTVYDMALLLKYGLKNEKFREVITSARHSTPGTNVHPDGITFYSTLFRNLSDPTVTLGRILGGKTGYTSEAGQCLASFAEIEGKEYLLVTAGAPGESGASLHIQDAQTVYNRLGEAVQILKHPELSEQ